MFRAWDGSVAMAAILTWTQGRVLHTLLLACIGVTRPAMVRRSAVADADALSITSLEPVQAFAARRVNERLEMSVPHSSVSR
jgi:hypothetical protein